MSKYLVLDILVSELVLDLLVESHRRGVAPWGGGGDGKRGVWRGKVLLLTTLQSLLKPPIFSILKSLGFSRKEPSVRWAWSRDSMLVHTLQYLNLRGVLKMENYLEPEEI